MPFENPCLAAFAPIFLAVLREKGIALNQVELVVFDEEAWEEHSFEWVSVAEVLHQLREDLNVLTIYTDRREAFLELAETAYEENGLVISVFSKKEQHRACRPFAESEQMAEVKPGTGCKTRVFLDFEWRGPCYSIGKFPGCYYVPIHKKPWKMVGNLDIEVPFSYNTVIVKGKYTTDKRLIRDRFDEGFYRDE